MSDGLLIKKTFASFDGLSGGVVLSDLCQHLLDAQRTLWNQLAENDAALKRSDYRDFMGGGFSYRVQYNPGRIKSARAKIDPQSIAQRKCFLCLENLPVAQQGILYRNEYFILCNPWPIFPGHLTIAHLRHLPQAIENSFACLLRTAQDLSPRFTLFYNGPSCGASAPDHLHFQAVPAGSMPIERDAAIDARRQMIHDRESVFLYRLLQQERAAVIIEGNDFLKVQDAFRLLFGAMRRVMGHEPEPMMNVVCSYCCHQWRVIVFPRKKFRPSAYDLQGDKKILISPGAVEMGGFIVAPRKIDFERMDREKVSTIYREVSIDDKTFRRLETIIVEG
ncbi:MAG: DUF4922 domain-containing protein [Deltaproteobacteria bacterium]|nr:DUF4922 domain-containing protein [Deltaproteobacteria bacterium]